MGLAPTTEFVRRGNGHLAYQVFGDGPARVLEINAYATHREQLWQMPVALPGQERLGRMARVAQYDWRGYGMSDALPGPDYPIEELAADALAVLDAAEFEQAVLWGDASGGAVAIWLAVYCADRVTGVVLDNASASVRAQPGYEVGFSEAEISERRVLFEAMWGTGATLDLVLSGSVDDDRLRSDWARYERILIPAAQGRYLAERIPGARYFEVHEDAIREWDSAGLGGEVSEFLTGSRAHAHVERSLLVVLFTDIAGSTDQVAALGDAAWRETLDSFRRLVRLILDRLAPGKSTPEATTSSPSRRVLPSRSPSHGTSGPKP